MREATVETYVAINRRRLRFIEGDCLEYRILDDRAVVTVFHQIGHACLQCSAGDLLEGHVQFVIGECRARHLECRSTNQRTGSQRGSKGKIQAVEQTVLSEGMTIQTHIGSLAAVFIKITVIILFNIIYRSPPLVLVTSVLGQTNSNGSFVITGSSNIN